MNLSLAPGTILEIIGDSGAGKTVLAETLLGVQPKSAGTILCGGTNIERLSSQQAGRMFGYVPETVSFINGTIADNISRLALNPDKEKVYTAAKLARVHKMILALPNGYQTMIDTDNCGFSKGQKHQIALARALYDEPKILIIDEPDLALRNALSGHLTPTLEAHKNRGGVVVILSRKRLSLSVSSGCLLLENGRLNNIKAVQNVTDLSEKKALRTAKNLARG